MQDTKKRSKIGIKKCKSPNLKDKLNFKRGNPENRKSWPGNKCIDQVRSLI